MSERDYGAELQRVYEACAPSLGQGTVADYIPELADADPRGFGLCLHTVEGQTYEAGDVDVPFTIQSISKVIVLAMVLPRANGCFRRVMVEPSGDPFNSLVQLEYEAGIPRNPFINAGALVVGDLNDPQSDASRLISSNSVKRIKEDLGTEPKVCYIGL